MSTSTFNLAAPPDFDFWRTAYSHGWADLPPFSYDADRKELTRVLSLSSGKLVQCRIREMNGSLVVSTLSKPILPLEKKEIRFQLGDCLRLNEDFGEFHREARRHTQFRWIAATGSGRMLRAPSMFEDAVKMICTTNCSWAFTKIMIANLTKAFGKKFDGSTYSFPTPEAIAGSTEKFLRKEIKAGYRSPSLLELAERIASRKLDVESWRTSPLPTEELFEQMLAVRGIGPYAAGNLMKLVGRYDYLGLDSWVRQQFYKTHKKGRKVQDSTIEKHYAKYGKWRGLFFWFEMTRYWHDEKFRL